MDCLQDGRKLSFRHPLPKISRCSGFDNTGNSLEGLMNTVVIIIRIIIEIVLRYACVLVLVQYQYY